MGPGLGGSGSGYGSSFLINKATIIAITAITTTTIEEIMRHFFFLGSLLPPDSLGISLISTSLFEEIYDFKLVLSDLFMNIFR